MAISENKKREIFEAVSRQVFFILTNHFGDDVLRAVHDHIQEGFGIEIEPVEDEIDNFIVIAVSNQERKKIV